MPETIDPKTSTEHFTSNLTLAFSDLMDVMGIAVWEFDLNYKVVNCNRKAHQIYGEDILGKCCYYIAARRDTVCPDCPALLVYDGQESGRSQHERIDISGKKIHIDHIATPIKNREGMLTGVLVLIIDITAHKQLEEDLTRHRDRLEEIVKERTEALKNSEKKYRQLIETSKDAIFIAQDGMIVFSNQRTSEMLGYSSETLKSESFLNFIHPDDQEMIISRHRRRLAGDMTLPNTYSFKIVKKDRSELTVQMSVMTIDWEGRPATLNFVQDITEQKRLEDLIIQNEKMLSVGGLAAGMAHEINNPLAGMIQNAQVVLNRLSKQSPVNERAAEESGVTVEGVHAYMQHRGIIRLLENIQDAGRNAAGIVRNMLSFARKSDSNKILCDLTAIVEKSIDLAKSDWHLNRTYDFKKIEITRDWPLNFPPVLCEESKIQQVLFNIIKNASEAMGLNDRENKSPKLAFRLSTKGNMAQIVIEDNGPGIPPETKKRIFEPFFTTRSVEKGTGLGLSVSYYIIVNDHRGEIEVESSPGQGTAFIIRLPLAGNESGL